MTILEPRSLELLERESTLQLLFPGDDGYAAASTAYGRAGSPALVAQPANARDTVAAVRFAAEHGLEVSVRCGGHSSSGYSTNDDGMVIDLSRMTEVELLEVAPVEMPGTDDRRSIVGVGGGATWGDIAEQLRPHALVLSSGDTRSVGVGGLTLGGGIGWLVRQYGLALDSLVEAEVVTADGDLVIASERQNAELFWALRGGGGNFGVVTRFTFRAHPLDGVFFGAIQFDDPDIGQLLRAWRDVMREAPEELNTTFLSMPEFGGMPAGTQLLVLYAGSDEEKARAAVAPLLEIPGVSGHSFEPMAYAEVLDESEMQDTSAVQLVDNNGFSPEFSDAAIDTLAGVFSRMPGSVLMIRYLRGAFNRVPADATAFAYRDSEVLLISAAFLPAGAPLEAVGGIRAVWGELGPYLRGIYGNFSSAVGDVATPLMYPPETLARLERVKGRVDPQNLFAHNHNIRPVVA
jgi:FAD/FMN-containing dehydrogenase